MGKLRKFNQNYYCLYGLYALQMSLNFVYKLTFQQAISKKENKALPSPDDTEKVCFEIISSEIF